MRATTPYMAGRGKGVAYPLWLRVEQERIRLGLTKMELWQRMKAAAPDDAPAVSRGTIDNLRDSTRAPQPRIVHALADALGIDRDEAAQLAGLVPSALSGNTSVRESIVASSVYTDAEKQVLLGLLDVLDAAKGQPGRSAESA
jgi:hypothetical protein